MAAHRIPKRLRKSKSLTVMIREDQFDIFQIIADMQGKANVSEWVRDTLETKAAQIRRKNPDRFKELREEILASA